MATKEKKRGVVSLNHTSYGYLRGAEALAQALPNVTGVALRSYAVVGGTGAPPVIARLREATDKATIN